MNLREHLYTSGAGITVAHVTQRRTGRRVAVLDPYRRSRGLIVKMLLDGRKPREIARTLDLPLRHVCLLGIAGLRQKSKVGLFP